VRLSKTKVQELWDNGLNVMDIAMNVFASVGDPDLRAAYDREYERGIDRDTKKKLLQSYSERILKKLFEGDIKLSQRNNLTMADIGLGDATEEIDGTLRIIQRRKGLIEIHDNTISLTAKGRKESKKIK
jgi:hypothetical protein